jgi:hypothetical protein
MKKSSPQQVEATFKTLGKTGKSLSQAMSHMQAMGKNPSLGSLLRHGLKAAKELQEAARELSKLSPGSVRKIEGESSVGGGRAAAVQPKGVKLMVGRPQKNWEHATAENGFHEVMGGKVGGDGKRLSVMVGKPQKNWEQATAEHGYHELKPRGGEQSGAGDGKRLRVMLGPIHRNWEHATAENGFTEWKGKFGEDGKDGPRLRIMVGKPRLNRAEMLESLAPHGNGVPRISAVAGKPVWEEMMELQDNLRRGSGESPSTKQGGTSLSNFAKVTRPAGALDKEMVKSHD